MTEIEIVVKVDQTWNSIFISCGSLICRLLWQSENVWSCAYSAAYKPEELCYLLLFIWLRTELKQLRNLRRINSYIAGCLNQCTFHKNSVTKSNVVEITNLNNEYKTYSGRRQNLRSLATLGPFLVTFVSQEHYINILICMGWKTFRFRMALGRRRNWSYR